MNQSTEGFSERLYVVTVQGEVGVELTEAGLIAAWRSSIPDLALQIRALKINRSVVVFTNPVIEVRRVA